MSEDTVHIVDSVSGQLRRAGSLTLPSSGLAAAGGLVTGRGIGERDQDQGEGDRAGRAVA
ncbi:MAG: hypothetical protein LBH68_05350 [Bifidobacteriaceae bacterium]|nr:hypothetical protein [Bifidobacteriaceae bacterium]